MFFRRMLPSWVPWLMSVNERRMRFDQPRHERSAVHDAPSIASGRAGATASMRLYKYLAGKGAAPVQSRC